MGSITGRWPASRSAFYGGATDDAFNAAANLVTPDEPVRGFANPVTTTAAQWGGVQTAVIRRPKGKAGGLRHDPSGPLAKTVGGTFLRRHLLHMRLARVQEIDDGVKKSRPPSWPAGGTDRGAARPPGL